MEGKMSVPDNSKDEDCGGEKSRAVVGGVGDIGVMGPG